MSEVLLAAAGGQIQGERAEQQDRFARGTARLADGQSAPLLAVVDGMGGHQGGAVAAELAIEALLDAADLGIHRTYSELLRAALATANRAIGEGVRDNPQLKGMGCTLVAAIPDGQKLHYLSVGDSLLLRQRDSGLERINDDHSMAPLIDRAVADGAMDEAEARHHPQRSALRSALTGSPISLVDAASIDIAPGQCLILASDGLLTLGPPDIAEIVVARKSGGATAITSALLDRVSAAREPEQDNCTVIAFFTEGAKTAPGAKRKAGKLPALMLIFVGLAIIGMVWWILTSRPPVEEGSAPPPVLAADQSPTQEGATPVANNSRVPGFDYGESDAPEPVPAATRTATRRAPAADPAPAAAAQRTRPKPDVSPPPAAQAPTEPEEVTVRINAEPILPETIVVESGVVDPPPSSR